MVVVCFSWENKAFESGCGNLKAVTLNQCNLVNVTESASPQNSRELRVFYITIHYSSDIASAYLQ